MNMMNRLHRFLTDETGAVTVDWVVLTAAIVGLGMVVLAPIFSGTTNVASNVSSYVTSVQVGYSSN